MVKTTPLSASKKKPYYAAKDNTAGMIKGNTVTNAVTLAIARSKGEVSLEELKDAAKDVLRLHRYLESLDITKIVKGEK